LPPSLKLTNLVPENRPKPPPKNGQGSLVSYSFQGWFLATKNSAGFGHWKIDGEVAKGSVPQNVRNIQVLEFTVICPRYVIPTGKENHVN